MPSLNAQIEASQHHLETLESDYKKKREAHYRNFFPFPLTTATVNEFFRRGAGLRLMRRRINTADFRLRRLKRLNSAP